jgi:PST family polysaccharide transporter
LIAEVAHVPQLPPIMMALSGCLILLTLALPSNALLTRQGRIGINSLGETIGSIVGSAAAIALAFNGAGTWSLVAQTLLIYIFRTSYVLLAAPFKPAWHFAMKDLRPHLAMGRSIVGSRLADTGGRMAESTLIARLLGAGMVGTYSFANQAPRFICDSVGNSLWVMLYAHTIRTEDTAEAMNTYRIVLRTFGLVVFPVVILVAAQAHELIFHLLGPKWGNSVFMLQVILIFYSVTTLGGLGMPILYAKGRSDIQFKIACESAALRIGCVCCAPWIGMNGVAIGFGVAYTYVFVRYVLVMRNFLGIPIAPYFAVVAGPAFAATVAGILCWRLGRLTHPGFMLMVGEMALGLIMYGLVLLALERRRLMQDWRAVRQLMKRA